MKNKNTSYGNSCTNIGKAEKIEINYISHDKHVINYRKKVLGKINTSPRNITLVGILGAVASIVAILSIVIKFPITETPSIVKFIAFLIICFVILFIISTRLSKRKYIPIFGNYSIESDSASIYLKRIKLFCPKCNSTMKVFQNPDGVFVACERNPEQHKYNFDYTTFEDND